MKKIIISSSVSCLLLVMSSFLLLPKENTKQYISNYENVLGTSLELRISTTSEEESLRAEEVALAEIDRLSKILSGYDQDSEFSRWLKTKDQPVPVSQELFEVLSLFDTWRERTHGALDASAETVSRVWRSAAAAQRLPSEIELHQAIENVKQKHWTLDAKRRTATHLSDAPLILNSFAKSYIIDKACDAILASRDVDGVVVNVGGDIIVRGDVEEPIEITDPRANAINDPSLEFLKVKNKTVATSGNYRRGVMIRDYWYSHIVDPRTALPVDHIISASVVSSNPTNAAALATAFNVLTVDEAQLLASTIHDIEYLMITKEGERIESDGWNKFIDQDREQVIEPHAVIQDKWNGFELAVNIELTHINTSWYKRPFVAVWIENPERQSVRNLAVWFGNIRWISELKYWYRTNWAKANLPGSKIGSIASSTHSPGKYMLKWDGKDDDGNLVEPGKYTVLVESVRELGPYLLLKQEIELAGTPKQITIQGTGENPSVSSVTLDYHKKQ